MKAVILSISTGFGHKRVAHSIQSYLEDQGQQARVIDILEYVSPLMNKIFTTTYLRSVHLLPEIYSFLYKKEAAEAYKIPSSENWAGLMFAHDSVQFDDVSLADIVHKLVLEKKLREMFEKESADVIVSTHPFIGEVLDIMFSQHQKPAPLITVVTDYVVHPNWINQSTDRFVFPSEKLRYNLQHLGVSMKKVAFLGIPIDPKFNRGYDRKKLREKYGIQEDRFTYMLMGGGYGLGDLKKDTRLILNIERSSHVIVACGRNESLYRSLKKIKNRHLYPFAFTDDIHELMALSDVLLSKPGGITITECMAMGIPLIIRKYLPGQEERNMEFILNHHLGLYAKDNSSLIAYLKLIRNDARFRQGIIESFDQIRKTDSLEQIYRLMNDLAQGQKGQPFAADSKH